MPLLIVVGVIVVVGLVGFGIFSVVSGDGGDGGLQLSGDASIGADGIANPLPAALADDSDERWTIDTDGRRLIGASAAGSSVYAVLVDYDRGRAELVALSQSDGEERWSSRLDVEYPAYADIDIVDGDLVVAVSSEEGGSSLLASFDAGSGEERWSNDSDGFARVGQTGSGDLVAISYLDARELTVLDADTGEERWGTRGEHIAVAGSHVYVLDRGEIEKLDADGEEVWSVDVDVDDDEQAYALSATEEMVAYTVPGEVFALSADSGEEVWSERFDADYFSVRAAGDHIVVGEDGTLSAFDASGDEVWSVRDGGYISHTVRSGGETFIVSSRDDRLALIDVAEGEELGDVRISEPGLVRAMGDRLLIEDDGELRSLSLDDLEEHWSQAVPADSESYPVPSGVLVDHAERDELLYFR